MKEKLWALTMELLWEAMMVRLLAMTWEKLWALTMELLWEAMTATLLVLMKEILWAQVLVQLSGMP
jgi:hypothetical protein